MNAGDRLPFTYQGMDIRVYPDQPKYTLPEEVCPGVPWPPGFRDMINTWSVDFLGTTNSIEDGKVLVLMGKMMCVNPRTYELLKKEMRRKLYDY